MLLEDLFAGRAIDLPQMLKHMKGVAAQEGLPFGDRKKTFNSRRAQELAKWAESKGQGDVFHDAVFRAYFVDGKNISKTGNLVELAESLRLSGKEARVVLKTGAYREAVDQDWMRSRRLGVTAVPTFLWGQKFVVGAQPYEVLANFVSP